MTLKRAYLILLFAFVWLIGLCIVGSLVDTYVGYNKAVMDLIYGTALVGCSIWLLVGFAVWAGAKGYSPLLGAFLAWMGPLGMLILVFLPDRSAKPAPSAVVSDRPSSEVS